VKKKKKLTLPNPSESSNEEDYFPSDWDIYFSKLSEEEKQILYEEDWIIAERDYYSREFFDRIESNRDYIDIINKLIIETDKDKGLTAYRIAKDLAMDQGTVRKYLIDLKEEDEVLMIERPKKGRMRHEYWMDMKRKTFFIAHLQYLGVNYEKEVNEILILLSERKLINPKIEIKEKTEPRNRYSLNYRIGDEAFNIAQNLIDTYAYFYKLSPEDKVELFPYGIAFNTILDAIFRGHIKRLFGNKERIKELNIFPYPRIYEFYDFEEFVKDAKSLKEKSKKLIERMFFREPEFIPKIKNGGNKS